MKKYSAFIRFHNDKKGYMQYSTSLNKLHKLILLHGCTSLIIYDLHMNNLYTYTKKNSWIMKTTKHILLIYSRFKNKPYLLTWVVCKDYNTLVKEYESCLDFDNDCGFTQYRYKWLAFELETKNKKVYEKL